MNHKIYLATRMNQGIPEKWQNAPFATIFGEKVMNPNFSPEEAIDNDFAYLTEGREVEEYRFFLLSPEYKKILHKHLEDVLESFHSMQDFKKMITIFPEYAPDIYTYLLKGYLGLLDNNSNFYDLEEVKEEDINIVKDVLIPMADLERYQGCYFKIVRDYKEKILENTLSYYEYWDALYVLENQFNIPAKEFEVYLKENMQDIVDTLIYQTQEMTKVEKEGIDYTCYLSHLFRDRKACNYIWNRLPYLLSILGLDFYDSVVKLFGKNSWLESLYYNCKEMTPFVDEFEKQ